MFKIICPKCGYVFKVKEKNKESNIYIINDGFIFGPWIVIECPNCNHTEEC